MRIISFPHIAATRLKAVLGYPALAAMGSLTVTSDNTIEVHPAKEIEPEVNDDLLNKGARFFLDGDQVIVALGHAMNSAATFRDDSAGGQSGSDASG